MNQRINSALLAVIAVLTAVNTVMIGMGNASPENGDNSNGNGNASKGEQESNVTATKRDRDQERKQNDPKPQNKKQDRKSQPQNPPTTIEFEKYNHDFGTVKAGEKVTKKFEFKNTGDKPYVIQKASGSCGCTVPEYPKKPIQPGGSGKITVNYSPKKRMTGQQNNSVTLVGNTQPRKTKLRIKANVEKSG